MNSVIPLKPLRKIIGFYLGEESFLADSVDPAENDIFDEWSKGHQFTVLFKARLRDVIGRLYYDLAYDWLEDGNVFTIYLLDNLIHNSFGPAIVNESGTTCIWMKRGRIQKIRYTNCHKTKYCVWRQSNNKWKILRIPNVDTAPQHDCKAQLFLVKPKYSVFPMLRKTWTDNAIFEKILWSTFPDWRSGKIHVSKDCIATVEQINLRLTEEM